MQENSYLEFRGQCYCEAAAPTMGCYRRHREPVSRRPSSGGVEL